MKKTLLLSSIAAMALHSFADAQQDSTATTKAADSDTSKHKNYVADIVTHKAGYLQLTPEYNFTKLMDGLALGLQTTNGSGQPGNSADMLIRGMGSITGDIQPLILLDGIPYYGDFAAINKNDIVSINILNDAASTFLFANRGSNGIISIKTKSSITGARNTYTEHLEVNAQFGISTPELPAYKTLNTKQYLETVNTSLQNAGFNYNVVDYGGGYNPYNVSKDQLIGSDGKLNPNAQLKYQDSWRDEMIRPGIRQNYDVATSGSSNKGAYYLSAGYLSDKGYVQQTDYQRFSTRFNSHLNVTRWLKVGVRSQFATSTQHFVDSHSGLFRSAQLMAPIYPVYYRNANGDKEMDPAIGMEKYDWGNLSKYPNSSMGDRTYGMGRNDIASLYLDNNASNNNTLILNPYLSAALLKHFTYSADFNYGFNKTDTAVNYSGIYGDFSNVGGCWIRTSGELKQLNFRQKLEWEKQFKKHHLTWLLGNDYIKQSSQYHSEDNYVVGGVTGFSNIQGENHMLSYYTLASYDYNDKYFISGGIRKDQTLVSEYKWQTNGFAQLAYKISNENFLRDSRWINDLFFKINYGTQGHNILSRYQYINPTGPVLTTSVLPNQQWSGSIEGSFFDNKLSFEIQAYSRNTASYALVPDPGVTTTTSQMKLNNKGFGFYIGTNMLRTSEFRWNTSFRWNYNINKVTAMPNGVDSYRWDIYIYKKGVSTFEYYLPEYAGVDKSNGNALYYLSDNNGNKTTTPSYDSAAFYGPKSGGSALPTMYGSFVNTFEWNHFQFSFQVNYSIGGKYYDAGYQALVGNGGNQVNWSADILNAWTPSNTNTDVPKLNASAYSNPVSTRFLKDASYLNFANAYLGYSFNHNQVKKLKMQSLNIYISANNLYLITGRKGMNPQANFYNYLDYAYSPARTIVIGLKVGI